MGWDRAVFHWINGLAGHFPPLDYVLIGVASDYLVIISMCLVLVAMWFGTRDQQQRRENQLSVTVAMSSLGLATAAVALANLFFEKNSTLEGTAIHALFNRPRPFEVEEGVALLFYRPTDPSFPSNLTAVVFGLAIAVRLKNKKVGNLLLGVALLASLSRVYVGIHYPGDILGGILFAFIGVGWALVMFALFRPLKRLLFWVLEKLYLGS